MDIKDLQLHIHSSEEKRVETVKGLTEEKKSLIIKLLPIVIPIIIAIVLILAVIPPYVQHKAQYEQATELLDSGMYEEARDAFAELGNFADSKEQAEKNVDYMMALNILSSAGDEDTESWTEAKEIFIGLDGYKESEQKLTEIDGLFEQYNEKLNKEAYDAATELLQDGKYVSAASAFSSLGAYKDSSDMVKECYYLRADKLLDEIENADNLRNMYVRLTPNGEDYSIIKYTATEEDRRICTVAAEAFSELGNYKDSAEKAALAEEYGDFTREFYALCSSGKLTEALDWLNRYDDEIPDREGYIKRINSYLPYISTWSLKGGDPTLIPWSAGVAGNTYEIATTVCITDDGDFLEITGLDLDFKAVMNLTDDARGFVSTLYDNNVNYFATINQVNNFAFMKYYSDGSLGGSAEYRCQ